ARVTYADSERVPREEWVEHRVSLRCLGGVRLLSRIDNLTVIGMQRNNSLTLLSREESRQHIGDSLWHDLCPEEILVNHHASDPNDSILFIDYWFDDERSSCIAVRARCLRLNHTPGSDVYHVG